MKKPNWLEHPEARKGLALGGGGARGCYEIGFWKAMDENGIHFDAVAGTSIGALVGAMYVQGALQPMLDFVEHLEPVDIAEDLFAFPETLSKWIKNRKEISSFLQKYIFSRSGMDISPLRATIDSMFDYEKFAASSIDYGCMTFNLTERRPVAYKKAEMNEMNAKDIILASASCYPAFPVLEMNGKQYIDGGYYDNVPIDLVADENCRQILAIDVEGPGLVRPVDPSLDVFEIKPLLPLMNFLDFTAASGMKNLQAGYLETLKLLEKRAGAIYTFPKEQEEMLEFLSGYLEFRFRLEKIPVDEVWLDTIARWGVGMSKSDLSNLFFEKASFGLLTEVLAFIVGIDAYRQWDVMEFLAALTRRLHELHLNEKEVRKMLGQIARRSIDRTTAICFFHWMIRRSDDPGVYTRLQAAAAVYPSEVVLAWTWFFLEELEPLKEDLPEQEDFETALEEVMQTFEQANEEIPEKFDQAIDEIQKESKDQEPEKKIGKSVLGRKIRLGRGREKLDRLFTKTERNEWADDSTETEAAEDLKN